MSVQRRTQADVSHEDSVEGCPESQGPPRSYGVVRGEVTEMYALLVGAMQARDHHSPMVLFVER